MTPTVSFAGACNRPSFFEWHLASLDGACAGVEYECIYVGEAPFPAELKGRWPRLRYYRAEGIKPAACAAWALSQAGGHLLYHAIDDYDWEPNTIRQMVDAYFAEMDPRLMPSPRYFVDEGGPEQDWTEFLRLDPNRPDLPYLPLDGLISREFYDELGGIDKRFSAVMQMVDVFARAVQAGGRTVFPGGAVHERRTRYPSGYASICDRHYFQGDRPLLESLWWRPGERYENGPRLEPVQPYTAEDLAAIGAKMELCSE